MSKGIQVYEKIKQHLTNNNFSYKTKDDDLVIFLTVHGDDLPQPTIIHVIDDRNVIQVLSPIPGNVPEEKRMEAAVAVAVANYGMLNGSFDLDMSDGEIRFRCTQSYAGVDIGDEMIKYLLSVVFFTTDRYNDKFFMLNKGMMSLEQFIEQENAN